MYWKNINENPNFRYNKINKSGVMNSTSGYCQLILMLHSLHLPIQSKYPIMGIFNHGGIDFLQWGQ